ncbi:NACHT domain-containing protein [Kineosporia mesophila]|nr:HEAT repeat domain-containing protein [Kineosporia mesophila]MCD5352980.1 HEAT repeat domain-containing protein [Kineosporia mesophila]
MTLPPPLWEQLVRNGSIGDEDLPSPMSPEKNWYTRRLRPARPLVQVLAEPDLRAVVLIRGPGPSVRVADLAASDRVITVPLDAENWREPVLDPIEQHPAGAELAERLNGGGQVVVVFDGLDQVPGPDHRLDLAHRIAAFTEQYRQARVIVTTRPVGYEHSRARAALKTAGFAHFTLLGPAELPRERWAEAVLTLAGQWPVGELTRQDKVELLGGLARHLREELGGNHIDDTALDEYVGAFLRERLGLTADVATGMLQHLGDGDVILTGFGAGVYGFTHPELLDHLAAEEFRKQLSDDDLVALCDWHGDDPDWAMTLQLLIGRVPGPLAARCISTLLTDDQPWRDNLNLLPYRLVLALRAVGELRDPSVVEDQAEALAQTLMALLTTASARERRLAHPLSFVMTTPRLTLGPAWPGGDLFESWYVDERPDLGYYAGLVAAHIHVALLPGDVETLRAAAQAEDWFVGRAAVEALATQWPQHPQTLAFLHEVTGSGPDGLVGEVAVRFVAANWPEHPDTLEFLRGAAIGSAHERVRQAALETLATGWAGQPGTLTLLQDRATDDENSLVRQSAVRAIATGWPDRLDTLPLLRDRARHDKNNYVRYAAVGNIIEGWGEHPDTPSFLKKCIVADRGDEVVLVSLRALVEDPANLPWLHDQARNGRSFNRDFVVDAISARWPEDPGTIALLWERATGKSDAEARLVAIAELAAGHAHHPQTVTLLRNLAGADADPSVRKSLEEALSGPQQQS